MFLLTYLFGKLLEKIRIPWIFSSLLIGFGLSIYNPFTSITYSSTFDFLAELGMLFLLFIIGFELNIKKIFSHKGFTIKATICVVLAEVLVGTPLILFLFQVPFIVALLVASSFATVGESVLLPILDEFKLTNSRLGQTILGVGVLDDFLEILTIIVATALIGRSVGHTSINIWLIFIVLFGLFALVYISINLHKKIHTFKFKEIPSFFLFVLFFIFLFSGLGALVESAALGAILAGIALRNLVPSINLKFIESEIRTLSYGFLAPIFFIWIGLQTNFGYLIHQIHYVLIIAGAALIAKVGSSYLIGRKEIGGKESVIMGVSLTVKMSTSIVIIKLLYDAGFINPGMFSVLVASSILFTVLVPLVLPILIKNTKLSV